MPVKRIGFVDYSLDNYHAEVYLKAFRGALAGRGYEVVGATALDAEASRAWAEERSLPYFENVESLAPHVDCFIVLAPSDPEHHLPMCQEVFPYGKPTFVDKTFAPDEATARAIFAFADEHGTAIQTTSALRTTAVQAFVRDLPSPVQSLVVFSSGTSFEEYGIHPVELAISCLGPDAQRVMRMGSARHPQWLLQFSDDRTALIDFNPEVEIPFSAIVSTQQGHEQIEVDGATLFLDAAASILDFFDAGRPLIDRRESLMVRKILDVAMSDDAGEAFVELQSSADHAVPTPHFAVTAAAREDHHALTGTAVK